MRMTRRLVYHDNIRSRPWKDQDNLRIHREGASQASRCEPGVSIFHGNEYSTVDDG